MRRSISCFRARSSAAVTGAAAIDFAGDGRAEVLRRGVLRRD
jgi:hypothetical protein